MSYLTLCRDLQKLYTENKGERFFSFSLLWACLAQKNGLGADLRFSPSPCPPDTEAALRADLKRLLEGYPLQYYLGVWEFRGRDYYCEEEVLIPREDTALLCELCEKLLPKNALALDFCCGSGIVGIDLLLNRPDARVLSADLSPRALSLTQKNAALHGVSSRLTALALDLFSPAVEERIETNAVALFAANPPYIPTADLEKLEINVKNEPALALDGGADGLRFYRRILELAQRFPAIPFVCEIGYDQRAPLSALFSPSGLPYRFFCDSAGNDRCFALNTSL